MLSNTVVSPAVTKAVDTAEPPSDHATTAVVSATSPETAHPVVDVKPASAVDSAVDRPLAVSPVPASATTADRRDTSRESAPRSKAELATSVARPATLPPSAPVLAVTPPRPKLLI